MPLRLVVAGHELVSHKPQVRSLEGSELLSSDGEVYGSFNPGLAIVGGNNGDPRGTPSAGDQSAEAVSGDYRSRLRAA
jgi:hypothetical protein